MCNELMGRSGKIYCHLYGCPTSLEVAEYNKLKWWQKLVKTNPSKLYYEYLPRF